MRPTFLALLSVLMVAAPAHAAHWTVDYTRSRLGFTVSWSNEPFSATFKSWTADIDFDPAAPAQSHVAATIELASEASGEPDFDDGLRGTLGFQTRQFPQARFVTRSIAHIRGNDYDVGTGVWTAPSPVSHDVTVTIDLVATKQ